MKMEGLSGWSEISPREILGNSAVHLDKEWMLLTAGDSSAGVAAMTINWGMFGFLWNKDAVFVSVRKSRHTLPFIERNGCFSLGIFPESCREKLLFCGRNSGRDVDKIGHCGFSTLFYDNIPFFAEADAVLFCRVMYSGDITEDRYSRALRCRLVHSRSACWRYAYLLYCLGNRSIEKSSSLSTGLF